MAGNPHFRVVDSLDDAEALVGFRPRTPSYTAGRALHSMQVFVMDHEMREVPIEQRAVELHFGSFVVSQSKPGVREARRLAIEVSYGSTATEARLLGREARQYELGPEVEPDDVDGRSPAIVTWHDDGVHFLVASAEVDVGELTDIAMSIYR